MDINDLTVGQAKELAAMFSGGTPSPKSDGPSAVARAVIVCTERRGVFFGYSKDVYADPMELKDARMCIYWSSKIGGVQGLADKGPIDAVKSGDGSRIAAKCDALLKGVSAVFSVTPEAEAMWIYAPVYGRSK